MLNDSAHDEQWERIRDHFPEGNIAVGRAGRKTTPTRCVLEAVLWILNSGAMEHAAAELPELQNRASALSDLVPAPAMGPGTAAAGKVVT